MSRKKLPERENDICIRLRNARLMIGRSQEYVASRIGIERSTLTNYESGVSPVRYEVALRFCRQLLVSEEWLACGETPSLQEAALLHGFKKDTDWLSMHTIFVRQCMDLLSDPISLNLRPGMAFSTAFDEHLAPRYKQLAAEFFYVPRVIFSANPETDLAEEFIACMTERWLKLLSLDARRHNQDAWILQRGFISHLARAGEKVFRDWAGGPGANYLFFLEELRAQGKPSGARMESAKPISPPQESVYLWVDELLETLALDPKLGMSVEDVNAFAAGIGAHPNLSPSARGFWAGALGRLQSKLQSAPAHRQELLDIITIANDNTAMQSVKTLAGLRQKLARLTSKRGAKAALARKFKVSRQAVDQWLSGATSPSTEVAIQILNLPESAK